MSHTECLACKLRAHCQASEIVRDSTDVPLKCPIRAKLLSEFRYAQELYNRIPDR